MHDPKHNQAQYRYHAKSIKRVPLDMQISDYAAVKAAAGAAGLPVNTWIKNAIRAALAAGDGAGAAPGGDRAGAAGPAGDGDGADIV